MVGQNNLKKYLQELVSNNKLPRFILVCGERGSEVNLIAPYIADLMGIVCVELSDVKVDTMRKMISQAYSVKSPVIYSIADADTMSANARNAILKVVEEPPNKVYFVMSVENVQGVIDTILSRAFEIHMEPYSKDDLREYYHSKYSGENEKLVSFANTPGEIDILSGQKDFFDYVQSIVDHMFDVSGAKALSMLDKVSVKADDDKYDLPLFLRAFQKLCLNKGYYAESAKTSQYKADARIKGINQQMLLDEWCLDMRRTHKNG